MQGRLRLSNSLKCYRSGIIPDLLNVSVVVQDGSLEREVVLELYLIHSLPAELTELY